jgi:predicted HTH domain antitoxin
MSLVIPDDILQESGLSEQEALLEFACSLYDAEKLQLWPAARLCGLDRIAFINELQKRHIPVFRPSVEEVEDDINFKRALDHGRDRRQ